MGGQTTMRAAVRRRYGPADGVAIEEVERPTPGEGEVLIRVTASSVNPADWHMMTGLPYLVRLQAGLRSPKRPVLGADVAGIVEAAGPAVTRFRPGDEVFGETSGAFAEYATAPEAVLAAKPAGVPFEQAAATPLAGLTALQGLRDKGRLRAGHRALVIGASGGVGTFAVQIAKALGAGVTGVCSSRNVDLVAALGADRVVDYTRDDFAATGPYDVILDNVGNRSLADCRRALADDGTYVLVGGPKHRFLGPMRRLVRVLATSPFTGQRLVGMLAGANADDLVELARLTAAGDVTAAVERAVPLTGVAAALRSQGEGHTRGKTVVTI